MWIESPRAQAWNSTTSCIVGNFHRTSKVFREIGGHVFPRKRLVPVSCTYAIPCSASLPRSRQVLPFPLPYREVNKATFILATLLLSVWVFYGRQTVKWIEPIERFVDAIVLLWLFDIIFKSVSRSSERLQTD
jgi:hypothetical protein